MKIVKNQETEFLSSSVKQQISILAEGIADYYCQDFPINPESIAKKKEISFSYGSYKDSFDGLLEYYKSKFHIYLNIDRLKNPYSERARFTFGHELGHYFIDHHRNSLLTGKSPSHSSFTGFVSKNYAEREADYFASCLLLPETRVKNDVTGRKFKFDIISELSKKYQTSFTATALRLADIGNHPIMVVYSQNQRINWYWFSNDFPYKGLLYGKDRVPEETVAGDYFYNGNISSGKQELFAMDWFKGVWEEHTNRKFYEQCLFNNDKVLSIIWED